MFTHFWKEIGESMAADRKTDLSPEEYAEFEGNLEGEVIKKGRKLIGQIPVQKRVHKIRDEYGRDSDVRVSIAHVSGRRVVNVLVADSDIPVTVNVNVYAEVDSKVRLVKFSGDDMIDKSVEA